VSLPPSHHIVIFSFVIFQHRFHKSLPSSIAVATVLPLERSKMNDSSDDDDQSYSELFAMLDRAVLEQSSTSRQVMLDQDDAEDPRDVADATQVARSPYDCDRSMSSKTSFASMDKMDALEHSPRHVDVLSKDIQGDKDIPKAMQWQKQQHQYQKGPSQDKSPDFSAAKDSDASVGTSSSSSETSNHSSPMGDGIGAQRGTLETSCIAGDQDVALELAEERDYSKDTVFDKADDACSATSGSSSTTSSSNSSSSLSASSSTTSSESKCNEKEEHDPYPFTAKLPITKDTKPTISNPYSKKTTTKTPTAVQEEIDSADDKAKAPMKRSGFFMAEDSDSDESSISMDGIRQNKTTTDGSPSKDSPLKEKDDDASLFSDDGTASSAAAAAVPTLRPEVTETPPREVQDYRPNINDPEPEIDPKLYAPPAYRPRRRPVLKQYNLQSHPLHARRSIAVTNLFSPPMDKLWTNKFQEFNHFQSEMARWMCDTDDNVVVSAPTGAGKSTIFEIAMARFLTMDLVSQGATASSHQSHVLSKARKMVYIAPSKALCEERYEDWSRRFQALQLGIEVAMITGDSADPGLSFGDLTSAHLIISTPEKWDSMTRRWQENFYLMASVKLLLVDEVHLLGDKDRGWCLEALVCRMKTIHRAAKAVAVDSNELRRSSYPATNPDAIKTPFRMVAVSATLPNIAEVADFFHANEAYSFDESYRPIPLAKHIMAMGSRGKNEWKFWNNLVCQRVLPLA
jgi:DEAD/DEAH box helicase